MHSYISNSEHGSGKAPLLFRRASIGILISCVIIVGAVEMGMRGLVYKVSANLSRIHEEAIAAQDIRREGSRKHVLIVGNSLLLHDIDFSEINRRLNPLWEVSRFAIEQTTYYDWYFGLKGLVERGARPDVVVLCFEARHLIQSGVRNDMFAHYLLQPRDVLDVMNVLNLSASETIDLLLANMSVSFALRKEVRQVALQRLIPELPGLMGMIARFPRPPVDLVEVRSVGKKRLHAVGEVTNKQGIRLLLLLVPPLPSSARETLEAIAKETAVPILLPLESHSLVADDYMSDGYHLNERGRKVLTEELIPLLQMSL